MKCKNCGGELLFCDGISTCQSCGTIYTLDGIYENIDVYICYEENDANGRRTKDSIIAQEVYNKLESKKINAFCERISASGLIGDDLEVARATAIDKAKVVIALATSVDNFSILEEKFSALLVNKKVIPFCVDVSPDKIPKTFSSIQALTYASIGWDKDLINGLNNLLGRDNELDIGNLFGENRKKLTIIISIVSAAILIGLSVVGVILFGDDGKNNDIEITQTETQVLTDKEIYVNATELLNQGSYIEALNLFLQIPDYQNSSNSIKLIYEKFEGYYWDEADNLSLHINISDNRKAAIEIKTVVSESSIKITESGELDINKIDFQYVDSENNSGKVTVWLEDKYVTLTIMPDYSTDLSIGEKNIQFLLSDKSDQPYTKTPDKETLLRWLDNKISIAEISRMGYELEDLGDMFKVSRGISAYGYKIKNTDIQLLTVVYNEYSKWFTYIDGENKQNDKVVIAISAPARIVLPDKIGTQSYPFVNNNYMFAPHGNFISNPSDYFALGICSDYPEPDEWLTKQKIDPDTIVNVASKSYMVQNYWDEIYTSTIGSYLGMLQVEYDTVTCYDGKTYYSRSYSVSSQSEDNMLISVFRNILNGNLTEPDTVAYYCVNKYSYESQLLYEYEFQTSEISSLEYFDIWEQHPELFAEFINS